MATIKTHKASPSTSRQSYSAYLSSSGGVDTRKLFTDHLYHALMREGLHTFRDDDELGRGEHIIPQIKKAIEGSRVSIIVLSKNYASSRYCLEQLVMILKCRSSGHLVLPVFYGVDPSEVSKQTGSFGEAFMRHERRIETEMGEQKEYLKGKVQEWRMALREVTNLARFQFSRNSFGAYESHIIQRLCIEVTEFVTYKNRAHPGRQDRCDFRASRLEDERTRGKRSRDERPSHVFSLDILQQHFGKKREDAAESLGISVSTLKRNCRYYGIPRWPNRIRNNVSGLPNPYGEKNPLPTFNTLSINGQITVENEVGGQNLEPNECLPDSFEDPNFQNTRIGSISEFGKTPTFYDSLPGHCRDAAPNMVPLHIGGSSEFPGCPNLSGIVDPHPQIASTQILSENMGTLEDLSIFSVSQEEPFMEEYGFGSINQTIPSCSNPTPSQQLMMPPLIASQDTNSVRVKATNGHTTIAFNLSFASGIIQLKEEVSKRLWCELGNFNLQYNDADWDWVSIACDDDVRDYLQLLTRNQVSKLFVS